MNTTVTRLTDQLIVSYAKVGGINHLDGKNLPAKSGIAGMTFVMARDLGSMGIRANAIAPSLFDTGLTAGIPEEFALGLTKDAAFPKKMGRPVHYAIQAIAIYENAMMNGGTVRVDAGQRFGPK